MYISRGSYYVDSSVDEPSGSEPLFVTSAGHERLIKQSYFRTNRPKGRRDYQILYVKKGCIYYFIDGIQHICPENSILIYRPNEPQFYVFKIEDNPDIYWVHFTGSHVEEWLKKTNIDDKRQYSLTDSDIYGDCIDRIIYEFQHMFYNYIELVNLLFMELLFNISRNIQQKNITINNMPHKIEEAILYFNTHLDVPNVFNDFLSTINVSTSWFIKIFKKQTGITPYQYLINLRIDKAKKLMCTNMNLGEISLAVGYADQLYFCRVFHKKTGFSPSKYREMQLAFSKNPFTESPWRIDITPFPSEKTD